MENILTERLKLELISASHINDVFKLYSFPEVCRFYDIEPFFEIEQAKKHVQRWIDYHEKGNQVRFGILLGSDFIGTCGLYMINNRHNRACLGYDLNPHFWGNGYAIEAVDAMISTYQNIYRLNRIQAEILEENESSIKLLRKLGFQKEGIFRQYEKWGEKGFVDLTIYSKIYGINQ